MYSHPIRDWGEEQGRPAAKMRRCITGESALAGRKIFRAFQIVPPSLRAVWESPWGLNFHEIRNINTAPTFFLRWELLCFPFPAGLRGKTGPPLRKNAPVHNGRVGPCRGKNLPHLPGCPAIAPGGLGKLLGLGFLMQSGIQNTAPTFSLSGGGGNEKVKEMILWKRETCKPLTGQL